jgi:nucleotide-binding universal stress UspA family protein
MATACEESSMSCYRNILIAHDGSVDAEAALEHAIELARDQRACLKLLTVVPPPHQAGNASIPVLPVEEADSREYFSGALRRAADTVPADIGLRTQLLSGNPADTILRAVREDGHDLVVMGSHGHGRLHRALLGSVSYRVLHDSPVPVLLIRHRRESPTEVVVSSAEHSASGSVQ